MFADYFFLVLCLEWLTYSWRFERRLRSYLRSFRYEGDSRFKEQPCFYSILLNSIINLNTPSQLQYLYLSHPSYKRIFSDRLICPCLLLSSRGRRFLLVLFRGRTYQFPIWLHGQGDYSQQGPSWPPTCPARWRHTLTHAHKHEHADI